eukprot:10225518-Ditylum_brightwellii.AAC.1
MLMFAGSRTLYGALVQNMAASSTQKKTKILTAILGESILPYLNTNDQTELEHAIKEYTLGEEIQG